MKYGMIGGFIKFAFAKTAFDYIEKEIANRTKQAKWTRDHIKEYPMNWYYYFETVPGKNEYYITHRQCGICKLIFAIPLLGSIA